MNSHQVSSTQQQSPRFNAAGLATRSILAMIVAMGISTAAHAEYRCSTPGLLTLWEGRACELTRQDTPEALIRYIHRINKVNAGLYIDDYVGNTDAERWEQARQKKRLEPLGGAAANSSVKDTGKTN
jgi:hypothetical protein